MTPPSGIGLTTTRAPFIEQARAQGQLYIEQPFELYSAENHQAWRELYAKMMERWPKYANEHFLAGVQRLCFKGDEVPRLSDVNRFLQPLTGFKARAVSGYIPANIFFDCLRHREFPTTITIRDLNVLDYLPEPDIFHDIAGHVPMHTDKTFAEILVRFGEFAYKATEIIHGIPDEEKMILKLQSIYRALARFFWFTIEFGLMRDKHGDLKAYGSGLLSSYGELAYCIESNEVQRSPIQIEWVIHQTFEIHHYQPLYFIIDSFDHLYELVGTLEKWLLAGKLDNVAPGDPNLSEEDLKGFILTPP